MKIRQSVVANHIRNRFTRPVNAASVQGGDVNIYTPQSTARPVVKRMPVTTFLRDTFFPGFQTFPTKHVLMDFYKNRQKVAPFVAEGSRPVNVRRDGYQTRIYEAPFINLSRPFDVSHLQTRLPGESVFDSGIAPADRALAIMQNDYNELDDMVVRREELMIAELLQSGVVTVTGYVDDSATQVRTDTIDYGFENVINLTGSQQWNQSGADPYTDLEVGANLVRQGGYNPEVVVLGEEAARWLLQNEKILRLLDVRNAFFGEINPQLNLQNGNGYAYLGRLAGLGLDLYQYLAWYYDETTDTLKPYIEPNKVIIGARDLGEMLYGAITMIPEDSINFVTIEAPRAAKVTVNRETDTKSLILKSRPVPKPFDLASWAVINTIEE
jgi:hypothetical protein